MTTKIRLRFSVALGALLALTAFAGTACSSSTPTASAAEAVRAASQNSSDASSVSFEMNSDPTSPLYRPITGLSVLDKITQGLPPLETAPRR